MIISNKLNRHKSWNILIMNTKLRLILFLFIISLSATSNAEIINGYAKVDGVTGTSISITAANRETSNHNFRVGEKLIIIQVQDNVIGSNTSNNSSFGDLSAIQNAGRYEKAVILSINGNSTPGASLPAGAATIVVDRLNNTYNTNSNSSVQIVTFRLMSAGNFTTTADITPLSWNGNIGGVVAFEVGGILTLAHSVIADGAGFRGGSTNQSEMLLLNGDFFCTGNYADEYISGGDTFGHKGEGIYKSINSSFNTARGKILNGGGGGIFALSGGAGGGNFSTGGIGGPGDALFSGPGFCTANPTPAFGGISLASNISGLRVFMGGGGGGGQQELITADGGEGQPGGNGGGLIFIMANSIVTSGSCAGHRISANGNNAPNSSGFEGGGGGGAGGSIVFDVNSWFVVGTCNLTISANGGNGSTLEGSNGGGGGAGGQGAVVFNTAQPTSNIVTQTNNGTPGLHLTDNSSHPSYLVPAGSASGSNGDGILTGLPNALPVELIYFRATLINKTYGIIDWATAMEINSDYFIVYKSLDAKNWFELSRVDGNGNSDEYHTYQINDNNIQAGFNYYKLVQTDIDGSTKEFGIKVIDLSIEQLVTISPNPTDGDIHFILADNILNAHITVLNPLGQVVTTKVISLDDKSISLPEQKGVYLVKVNVNGKVYTHKIIKK